MCGGVGHLSVAMLPRGAKGLCKYDVLCILLYLRGLFTDRYIIYSSVLPVLSHMPPATCAAFMVKGWVDGDRNFQHSYPSVTITTPVLCLASPH